MIPHNRPNIGEEEKNAVMDCLQKNILTSGEIVAKFEDEFSRYIGMNSTATSSGTHSLHLALLALGINNGDEVILPTFTCPTVALPILYQNAKPNFCDIDKDFNLSVDYLKKTCTDNTKAIIVPHMFGYPAKIKEIKEFCEERSIFLIEDCAQSIGSEYDHKKVGTFGDVSCFSFYATKVISSIKGGMVCTKNNEILDNLNQVIFSDDPSADKLSTLKEDDLNIDCKSKPMYNYHMSDVEAAVGRVQLNKIDSIISDRRKIAKNYINGLENCDLPLEDDIRRHIYMRFVIETKKNNQDLVKDLNRRQISSTIIHAPLLHQRNLFRPYAQDQIFPMAESKIKRMLSIPIFPSMSNEQLEYVINNINYCLK